MFWQIQHGKRILLAVYVDDIVITRDDTNTSIDSLKKYLQKNFKIKILDYFLDIEVARSKKDLL